MGLGLGLDTGIREWDEDLEWEMGMEIESTPYTQSQKMTV